MSVVSVGKIGVLSYLVNELEQDPVAKDKDGMTSIHAATQSEMVDTVKVCAHIYHLELSCLPKTHLVT